MVAVQVRGDSDGDSEGDGVIVTVAVKVRGDSDCTYT